MFVIKQCTCGSTDFDDDDDKSTFRCSKCGRLARIIYHADKDEEKEDIDK